MKGKEGISGPCVACDMIVSFEAITCPHCGQPDAGEKAIADARTTVGVKLWEFETGGSVLSSPAIGSDGTVYVGSQDNKLYAIKTDSKGLAKSPWPMRGQNAGHTGRVLKK